MIGAGPDGSLPRDNDRVFPDGALPNNNDIKIMATSFVVGAIID